MKYLLLAVSTFLFQAIQAQIAEQKLSKTTFESAVQDVVNNINGYSKTDDGTVYKVNSAKLNSASVRLLSKAGTKTLASDIAIKSGTQAILLKAGKENNLKTKPMTKFAKGTKVEVDPVAGLLRIRFRVGCDNDGCVLVIRWN